MQIHHSAGLASPAFPCRQKFTAGILLPNGFPIAWEWSRQPQNWDAPNSISYTSFIQAQNTKLFKFRKHIPENGLLDRTQLICAA
ncbi:MAG: hypothetical protein EA343_00160 [Nodularia sp. (in: Bacteria)]|nr:MAG: hypothetical protein EA343_00160 [Nodularia sp. (in: cyanobacteria)]